MDSLLSDSVSPTSSKVPAERLWADIQRRKAPFSPDDLLAAEDARVAEKLIEPEDRASRETVDQVLSRLTRANKLERVSRGLYSAKDIATLPAEPVEPVPEKPRTAQVASLIWQIAELLRGDYRPAVYGNIILPFTVLRRLDCVLDKTKHAVLEVAKRVKDPEKIPLDQLISLRKASGFAFYNLSPLTLGSVLADSANVRQNLEAYIGGFSSNVRDIFEQYHLDDRIVDLDEKDLLYKVLKDFVAVDLHPTIVSPTDMGDAFENLIRRFAELSNETAGEHYTPRDAIRLAVDLLLAGDTTLKDNPKPLRSIYDPTAGTGGMLSVAEDRIKTVNPSAVVTAFAQELNGESYAVCKADMVIKGQDVNNVRQGNTLSDDKFADKKFNWMLSNPPYGVDWKKVQKAVTDEHDADGFKGRFGPGLPRISDGQLLFLLHLVSKMQPVSQDSNGSRIAIVMNGSPLFSGGAGSGESDIRKYLFEHDLVEAIVGLPTEMFYNTGIATYIWILTNNKQVACRGKTQLIDATSFWQKMPKSLGNKRRFIGEQDIARLVKIHGEFTDDVYSKILPNNAFGYSTIVVERPLRINFQTSEDRLARLDEEKSLTRDGGVNIKALKKALRTIDPAKLYTNRTTFCKALDGALAKARLALKPPQYKSVWQALSERDETADSCLDSKRRIEADTDLRETENVPLSENIDDYFDREVKPYSADAWIDHSKTTIGYEVPFTRYFYTYTPPRALHEIDADLQSVTSQIVSLLNDVTV